MAVHPPGNLYDLRVEPLDARSSDRERDRLDALRRRACSGSDATGRLQFYVPPGALLPDVPNARDLDNRYVHHVGQLRVRTQDRAGVLYL
jgi:hypothetical protein